MDIKLMRIDIDGTLVNSKGRLTPKVKETIKQATAQRDQSRHLYRTSVSWGDRAIGPARSSGPR